MSRLFSGFPKTDSFSYRRFVELVKTSVDDDSGAWSRERGFVEPEVVTISLQRVIS